MIEPQPTCIYCPKPVNLRRGEGDHVIPDALGRFKGQFIFRRICRTCNSLIGRLEEQVLRCAPEAFVRRIVQAPVKRKKRGKAWVGSNRMPPPKFAIKRGDHQELVDPSTHDPLKVEAIDQLVIIDRESQEHHVRLFPKMTADQLRAKIAALEITSSGNKYLHCDEGALEHHRTILKEVFPDISFTERETTDAGIHQVAGRTTFVFHTDYWRAIAKIGFHYYLLNNSRGLRGDESEFADIRRFIIEGGDHEVFFTNPVVQFALPFCELPDGGAILPKDWAHVLAADESTQTAVAMVTLFIGPKRLAPTYHINLCRFRNPLMVPDARYVHAYLYHPNQSQYAGQVVAMTTTRLR